MSPSASKVSVIIATYNMGQYLPNAVDSVLSQTYRNLDVHVIDDGSLDGTRDLMEQWKGDPRVHYYWQENAGQTNAKNCGIRRSDGDFVAFCDADDLWVPTKLEQQMPLFDAAGMVGVVYGRNRQIQASGEAVADVRREAYYSGHVTEALFQYNFISFGTTVVRRSCLNEFGGFDEAYRMGIDWDLWLRISTKYQIRFLDDVVYLYRVWPGQMSNNWRGRYDSAFRIMRNFLDQYPGTVSDEVIRRAYAHSYTERARIRALQDGEYAAALADAWTALRHLPTYLPAAKVVGRVALTAVGLKTVSRSVS